MTNNIILGYSPSDFFYVKAIENQHMPKVCDTYLKNTNINGETCNIENIKNNLENCMNKELCINQQYVNKIYQLQNNHKGSDQKYLDTKQTYSDDLLNIVNLGIGIVIMITFIIKNNRI